MATTSISLEKLSTEADKAAAGAAAAKELVRTAKVELKKARKVCKIAKKAAKLARKKVEAAKAANASATAAVPSKVLRPRVAAAKRAAPPRAKHPAKEVRSASQAAQAVIARVSGSAPRSVSPIATKPTLAGHDSHTA